MELPVTPPVADMSSPEKWEKVVAALSPLIIVADTSKLIVVMFFIRVFISYF